jgi:Fur family transcriptional regulator, ferric uptake regulator
MDINSCYLALSKSGLRLTTPRKAIIRIVLQSDKALNAYEVHTLARREHPHTGLVTVYRTLEALEKSGLTERVHLAGHCRSVTSTQPGHTHILVCKTCGKTVRFEGEDLRVLMNKVCSQTGYEIQEHLLQLFGLCSECIKQQKAGN